jgi:ribosomal protein S18 acetylase RimI-like enzyme
MDIDIKPAYNQVACVRHLFMEYRQMLGVSLDFQNFEYELEHLPGKYAYPGGRLYLARVDNQAAGCIALRKIDNTICEMKRLFVRPEFRGHKIGQKLAETIIKDALQLQYQQMILDTFTTLTNAVALYQNLGFYEIEPYYENPLDNVIYLRLDL